MLSWRLSNTMDVGFSVSALEEALARFGKPEIFNTDQGSQFTSAAFTGTLAAAGVRISMDGRGRWMDNVFIERLWRSLKYEDIYLKGYADGRGARQPAANGGLACGRHRCARRDRCGHDAALGQRSRVAHMPTAATAAARGFNRVRDSGGRNGRASN